MLTGKVVSAWEILVAFPDARLPDASYAVVNSAWLAWYQEQFDILLLLRVGAIHPWWEL